MKLSLFKMFYFKTIARFSFPEGTESPVLKVVEIEVSLFCLHALENMTFAMEWRISGRDPSCNF